MVYKIDSDGSTINNEWTNGNPSLGIKATLIDAAWLNMTQRELVNVVEAAGLTPDKLDDTQLLQSLSLINSQQSGVELRSASTLAWDGAKIDFTDNIEIVYRSGAGARRVLRLTPASAPTPNEISLLDGEVVVVARDNASGSPVTLTYQNNYNNLVAGQWAIAPESSLTATGIADELVVFARSGNRLSVVPIGEIHSADSVFRFGSQFEVLEPRMNMKLDYDSGTGTFKVVGEDGNDLSRNNPAFIDFGNGSKISCYASGSFIDSTASSQIIGEEFHTTSTIAWAKDLTFFVYAVNGDNTPDGVLFAISPDPTLKTSPIGANTGWHSNPMSTPSQSGFFYLSGTNPTATHASKSCVCIGSFKMQKDVSDDWEVQSLTNFDGIGKFNEEVSLELPVSQMGATVGKYFNNNGGIAPTFGGTNVISWTLDRFGWVEVIFDFTNVTLNTPGSGAQTIKMACPFENRGGVISVFNRNGFFRTVNGGTIRIGACTITVDQPVVDFAYTSTVGSAVDAIRNQDLNNDVRQLQGTFKYKAFGLQLT